VPIRGFYVWEVPGKEISIQLSLDVVDRLQQDVMRGFGAVPRRGAEVGGVLLGTVASAGPAVRVQNYVLVPIEYKHGPSYRLSENDLDAFQAAVRKSRDEKILRPIGYFRSHTRDGVGLSDEDLALLLNCFPEPETIALLIRPFATKPSVAGFYFKEQGVFQSGPPLLEFPLRRRSLAPGDTAVGVDTSAAPDIVRTVRTETPRPAAIAPAAQRYRRWPVVPIFLLLIGILLGYQAALNVHSPLDSYSLQLVVTPSGRDVQLEWNRQSPAIRGARKAILTIEDGSYNKTTQLTQTELEKGSAVRYHPITKLVRFRLDVFPNLRNSISETVDWIVPAKGGRLTE